VRKYSPHGKDCFVNVAGLVVPAALVVLVFMVLAGENVHFVQYVLDVHGIYSCKHGGNPRA